MFGKPPPILLIDTPPARPAAPAIARRPPPPPRLEAEPLVDVEEDALDELTMDHVAALPDDPFGLATEEDDSAAIDLSADALGLPPAELSLSDLEPLDDLVPFDEDDEDAPTAATVPSAPGAFLAALGRRR